MPEHTIVVSGKDITFLVDSGATESVIKCEEFDITPKMSARYLRTMGATGTTPRSTLLCKLHFAQIFLNSNAQPVSIIFKSSTVRV